ncbi:MAG: L-rhamnose/proton symporter RhaT [Bacteroidota bacterium]
MKLLIGLLLATLGGGIQGAFVYPMKHMKNWSWENGWFIFTITCCLVFPLLLAFGTTPDLLSIYQSIDSKILWQVFLSGIAWGIGVVLFGLGAEYLGMALGIAIITALNAAFGTLFPIFLLPSDSLSPQAIGFLVAGLAVLIMGVVLVSAAGKQREVDQEAEENDKRENIIKVSFQFGLLVCIVAAIFCPATNFAVFFGQPISDAVMELGTVAAYNVGYAQLLPYFIGGFIVNSVYCIYLFVKNKSFSNYQNGPQGRNILLAISMSVLFIVGMVLYTIALTSYIENIGAVVGWPLFMAATIIAANLLGLMSGEWMNVSRKATNKLFGGISILIVAIVIVSLSNLFK